MQTWKPRMPSCQKRSKECQNCFISFKRKCHCRQICSHRCWWLWSITTSWICTMNRFYYPFPACTNAFHSVGRSFEFTFDLRICWSMQTSIQTDTTTGVFDVLATWRRIDILCGIFSRSNFVSTGWNLLANDCLCERHFRWFIEMVPLQCIASIPMGVKSSNVLYDSIVCGSETVE